MQNNKIIICPINKGVLFFDNFKENANVIPVYKELHSTFAKALRSIHIKLNLPFIGAWFTKEFKHEVKTGDSKLLFFDSLLTIAAIKWVNAQNHSKRIIYWHWNHVRSPIQLIKPTKNIECWSYDPIDCKIHDLRYNSQFYFPEFIHLNCNSDIASDVFFIGKEKGRKSEIEYLKALITSQNLTENFIVIGNKFSDRINNWIPYPKVIEYIKHTKCIIDIVPPEQNGLTLRPLEALFFQKKLITNFTKIKDFDFYNPQNIFIIGQDDNTSLNTFVNSPYVQVDPKVITYYSFKNWLNRFSSNDSQ